MRTNALTVRSATREITGEVCGTFLLVFVGLCANASGLLSGSISGLWQIASVWGFALAIAIYACGALSGAHFNPTVTIALSLFRRTVFNWKAAWYYILAQFAGVFLAAEATYLVWDPFLRRYEKNHNITRGAPGSFVTASIFGEYFPNPGLNLDTEPITPIRAMFVEAVGTFLLVFVIFAFSDKRNKMLYESSGFPSLAPFFIGFTLSVITVALAPITQAGLNPTRDFAARLVAYVAGWNADAIPGPHNGFWIYIVGPLIGGPLGGLVYEFLMGSQHSGSWTSSDAADSHPLLLNEEARP